MPLDILTAKNAARKKKKKKVVSVFCLGRGKDKFNCFVFLQKSGENKKSINYFMDANLGQITGMFLYDVCHLLDK